MARQPGANRHRFFSSAAAIFRGVCLLYLWSIVVPIASAAQADALNDFFNAFDEQPDAAAEPNPDAAADPVPVDPDPAAESTAIVDNSPADATQTETQDDRRQTRQVDRTPAEPVDPPPGAVADTGPRVAIEIPIRCPIDHNEAVRVRGLIQSAIASAADGEATAVLLFRGEGEGADDETDTICGGSEFEACLSLARLLAGPAAGRLRSIAFVDRPLTGHAVLVAAACRHLAVAPNAAMGDAGVDADPSVRAAYRLIAGQRGRLPPAALAAMVDPQVGLVRVRTDADGWRAVSDAEAKRLAEGGGVLQQQQVTPVGTRAVLNGQQLRQWQWSDAAPQTAEDLRETFNLGAVRRMEAEAILDQPQPVVFQIRGRIGSAVVHRCVRIFREADGEGANLFVLLIDSSGGDLEQSNLLASFLLELSGDGNQTVACITGEATGDAALIVMACDRAYAVRDARFGGDGADRIGSEEVIDLAGMWENYAARTGREAARYYGVISDDVPLYEYLTEEGSVQLANPDVLERQGVGGEWQRIDEAAPRRRIDLSTAVELGWIRPPLAEQDALAGELGVEQLPPPQQTSWIERVTAGWADNPLVVWGLLVAGIACFTTELTVPGHILSLFLSAIFFTGFFWLKFLSGTVETLEIVLFVAGLIAIALEVLVIPGFGIFGVGGAVACVAALILASQRFVIPVTSVQWEELSWNAFGVAMAMLVGVVVLIAGSSRMQNSPFFRYLELVPPPPDDIDSSSAIKPALPAVGTPGITTTACNPYGRASIGGEVREVRSEDMYIPPDVDIEVVEYAGETAVVRPSRQV